MNKTSRIQQQSMVSMLPARSLESARLLVTYVEAASYALLRRRILSAIAVCSIVWLASLWLTAALAQAQESPSNESDISLTQPAIAQASIATTEASRLVLSMVDRSELERSALPKSATQLTNPHSTDQHSTKKLLLPSEWRGSEYSSLAALTSAPSSSLLSAIQAGGSGHTDAASPAGSNKTLVYQLGAINLVINGLPNSFSVSSAGSSMAGAR